MQAQYRSPPNVRSSSHYSGKRQLLGNPAANVPPAWKVNAQAKQKLQEESKILLSKLPIDVGDAEVEVSNSLNAVEAR
jgi:THO complex subunit 4